MFLLNSSGLVVQVPENTPTVSAGAWGQPLWTKGAVGDPLVAPRLANAIISLTGTGAFPVSIVSGIRGTVSVSFVAGTSGTARTLWYLTDNLVSPTNRISMSVDTSNRPYISITNSAGAVVALVTPSYTAIAAGTRVEVIFSWDSTKAIDSSALRFGIFRVNGVAVASGDWATNPTAAWVPFAPTYTVVGTAVGGQADANGQIVSVQIANTALSS